MRAIQYLGVHKVSPAVAAEPAPAPGHALVKVLAAGVCQTDVHMRASTVELMPAGTVLGHEIAGTIAEINGEDTRLAVGQQVVVYPVWSCGVCRMCVAGRENACLNTAGRMYPASTPGVSVDGGLADYVSVPLSALVPADGLDPALAAVLPDAGLVPFHSISAAADVLRPGSTAVVIGIGGLGQFAVQLLRQLTGARIIAVDVRADALALVADQVDQTFLATETDVADKVLAAAGGHGADFVLDLVGSSGTLRLAGAIVAPYGAIRVPGLSDGVFQFETSQLATSLPWGASLIRPYSGTRNELHELVALARTGRITANLVRYGWDDALRAFDDLEQGKVRGRAVVMLDS